MQTNIIKEEYVYHCKQVQSEIDWNNCEMIELSETETGLPPKEATEVRACWTPEHLYIQFLSKDPNIVSSFENRNDPLYEQDVVEFFIDQEDKGTGYLELEVSPKNIVFDAIIENNGIDKVVNRNETWCFKDLQTSVDSSKEGYLITYITIPSLNFNQPLYKGLRWKVNFYRIDESLDGIREFQAWSPTRKVNFHIPSKFGTMVFE